jgi:hypothetical protein
MPRAIKLIDAESRSCYVPIMQNGKVVDSQGYVFDPRMTTRDVSFRQSKHLISPAQHRF